MNGWQKVEKALNENCFEKKGWWKNTFNIQVDASSGSKLSWGWNGIYPIEMSIHNFKSVHEIFCKRGEKTSDALN